jgi:uncharacterized protein HemY
MSLSRLSLLEQYYREDPNDPFNLYALALEYQKTDTSKSRDLFEKLLTEHSSYLPTYYHAAKLFADVNEPAKAKSVYENGIALARGSQDHKALRELQSAYNEFLFEQD